MYLDENSAGVGELDNRIDKLNNDINTLSATVETVANNVTNIQNTLNNTFYDVSAIKSVVVSSPSDSNKNASNASADAISNLKEVESTPVKYGGQEGFSIIDNEYMKLYYMQQPSSTIVGSTLLIDTATPLTNHPSTIEKMPKNNQKRIHNVGDPYGSTGLPFSNFTMFDDAPSPKIPDMPLSRNVQLVESQHLMKINQEYDAKGTNISDLPICAPVSTYIKQWTGPLDIIETPEREGFGQPVPDYKDTLLDRLSEIYMFTLASVGIYITFHLFKKIREL